MRIEDAERKLAVIPLTIVEQWPASSHRQRTLVVTATFRLAATLQRTSTRACHVPLTITPQDRILGPVNFRYRNAVASDEAFNPASIVNQDTLLTIDTNRTCNGERALRLKAPQWRVHSVNVTFIIRGAMTFSQGRLDDSPFGVSRSG